MFSKHKGEIGYLKKQPIRIGLTALLLLLSCAGIFMIGFINHGDAKNIFTVVAVLGTLPAAKLIVSFIMCMKAEKCTLDKETAEKIKELIGEKDIVYGFDFYLTSEKINFPLYSCFAYDGSLTALAANKNVDLKGCKEHLEKYLSNNSITDVRVYILDSFEKYSERINAIKNDYNKTDKDLASFALVKNLSL